MISYDSSHATSTKIETYVTDFMTELNILIVLNERLIMQSLYKSVKKSAQTDVIFSLNSPNPTHQVQGNSFGQPLFS